MTDWHTRLEEDLIEQFDGKHTESYGPDGVIDGDPVEVRVARTEDRFRVNHETHDELLEEGGSYIFDDVTDDLSPREVGAERVDELVEDDWYSDRGYEHQFVDVDEIF